MHRRRPIFATLVTLVVLLGVAACGKSNDKPVEAAEPAPSSTSAAVETTAAPPPPPPVWPLTGTVAPDAASLGHPAVVVKMDNSPDARPQTAINEADVVYELLVEGITRYALVYHSTLVDEVGPVRSARSSDPTLIANLGTPLLVWSGGNPGVTAEVRDAADMGLLIDKSQNYAGGDYWRDNSRKAPHNLYANIAAIDAATPGTPPPAIFAFGAAGQPPAAGAATAGITVDYGDGVRADYAWDAERGGWDRFQVDERHHRADSATVDANGVQVSPANVVVLFTEYGQSPSDARSPMALSTGAGEAIVLSQGTMIHGSWSRETPLHPWTLIDDAGAPIQLTPGRTWVSLPETGSAVTPLDAVVAGDLLAVRQ